MWCFFILTDICYYAVNKLITGYSIFKCLVSGMYYFALFAAGF